MSQFNCFLPLQLPLMMDVIKWRALDTTTLLVCILGSAIFSTLSGALCTAIIVASRVSGIVLVFQPGGASSFRMHSVITAA